MSFFSFFNLTGQLDKVKESNENEKDRVEVSVDQSISNKKVNLTIKTCETPINMKILSSKGSLTLTSVTSIGSSIRRLGSCSFEDELSPVNGISHEKLISPSNKKLKILIIDDYPIHIKLLKRLLERSLEFIVHTMSTGDEFLAKLDEFSTEYFSYDLILMDNFMPGTSGIECIRIAREKGYKKLMFGLTAMALTNDILEFREAGCDAILLKPFELEKFKDLIGNFGWKMNSTKETKCD